MDRFNVVFNGRYYYVVDRDTQQWFECPNEEAAHDKAAQYNYEAEEIASGQERFRNE